MGLCVGTYNVGDSVITTLTESGNSLSQTDKTQPEGEKRNYYGRVTGDDVSLTIDGVLV